MDLGSSAIQFYEANHFKQLRKLDDFYRIKGRLCDSFVYIL